MTEPGGLPAATLTVWPEADWREACRAHWARVHELTAGHQARRAAGALHPIQDFLFVYYSWSVTKLTWWYPGVGVGLAAAHSSDLTPMAKSSVPHMQALPVDGVECLTLDIARWAQHHGRRLTATRRMLQATAVAPARFDCFGLHEWAMVYGPSGPSRRHQQLQLRLPQRQIDHVVESSSLRCTHFDAYRFFDPAAQPLNAATLRRDIQADFEQPGCVHAGMDLYRYAYQLAPAVPASLVLRCFEHALDARVVDMQASPYDVSSLGYEPIQVETPQGRAEYVAAQRELASRASQLRCALIESIDGILDHIELRGLPVPVLPVGPAHRE